MYCELVELEGKAQLDFRFNRALCIVNTVLFCPVPSPIKVLIEHYVL